MSDYTVTVQYDKPKSGMWHCGPNPAWVTVKHNPTGIMARAYHMQGRKAREMALACVALMLEDSGMDKCNFPDVLD
jgi:hypothetical protein